MVVGQDLYKIKLVNILAGSGGGAHEPLPFTEKLWWLMGCGEGRVRTWEVDNAAVGSYKLAQTDLGGSLKPKTTTKGQEAERG